SLARPPAAPSTRPGTTTCAPTPTTSRSTSVAVIARSALARRRPPRSPASGRDSFGPTPLSRRTRPAPTGGSRSSSSSQGSHVSDAVFVELSPEAIDFAEWLTTLPVPESEIDALRTRVESVHLRASEPEAVTYREVNAGGVPGIWCQ